MKRLKLALALIAGFLLIVVILQNTETVETRILSATIELPRAILLLLVLLFGFALGFATAWWTRRKAEKRKPDPKPEPAPVAPPSPEAAKP